MWTGFVSVGLGTSGGLLCNKVMNLLIPYNVGDLFIFIV